ncbi:NAD(P)/FAD-dependent oxidoreductase [Desmonostoc muscorum LEGE 12446]|uniref:NAD(P)/FAD-dependent oxidoreductase n=1 Tax=Desmonostoc muscorum LEGE 12446 TaxID=1828758 RepID=A0A8J7A0K4_DESMC|nr:NAD(P)/FAD-dependent oxidoreductase [Desmonostoc muscorum]MCF2145573.1 NAD(P)/FAD-dependent oxidoreductase [Desmonostoc muscorum LEGE 12446]
MEIKQICVIGAGISGLVTAKTFIEEGYEVTVFEKQKGLGGVWEKSRTYPGLTPQNTGDTYSFSDYPMPASYPDWPTAEQMRNYLNSYATNFGVIEKIRFQTEVTNVSRKTGERPGWVVTINVEGETKEQKHEFDFVVACNGTFSAPKLPYLPGKEKFLASGRKILHSTEFNDVSIIEGKRVVVVGFGKSACDIATLAANTAKECTLVFRQPLWKVPRFFLGLVNLKYILLTRFAEAWFPYRQMGRLERVLHTLGKPLVWAFWRTNEMLLRLQFGLDSCGMLPEQPMNKANCNISVAPPDFFKCVHSGKIQAIKTSVTKFIPDGVELANGQQLQADIIVFATGFSQEVRFLEEEYRRQMADKDGNFTLYRYLIHPNIPQMGFVGYNTSFYSQLTSEVGAWWLAEYVKGNLLLPSPEVMYQEMAADINWMKTEYHTVVAKATCIPSFCLRYIEQLIEDMGVNNQFRVWKGVSQIMMPLKPSTYQHIRQQLRGQIRQSLNDSPKPQSLGVR